MKVIVCGAGQVGTSIVRHLAGENADVTVIDQSPELVRKIADTLDVQAMEGFASHPDVLEAAGIRDADMIIAVTYSDEVNMIACQVAHSLFDVPTKIARVRHQSYLQPKWSDLFNRENMPIDSIISPELEVGRAVTRRLWVPGAFDMIPLAGGLVRVIGVRCTADTPIINTPLRQLTGLFPDLNITIVGIMRGGKGFVPDADESMLIGDEVYFVADAQHVNRAMSAFGHEEAAARRVVILGGGNIGRYIARELENHPGVSAKLIEHGKARAEEIAQELRHTVVLNGDALDPEILEEANVGAAEAVIAVTNEDEVNILGSLLAKRAGCKRAITLINATDFTPLVSSLGIDVIVSPRAITVSTILQHIRRGRIRAVHSLGDGFGEVIEAEALETCSVTGKALKDIGFPEGVIIGAIVRGDEVINPDPDTIIKPKDRVVLFATSADVRAVEKMFSVGLAFF
ncbi:MAG TPA: Trk system potassium transporter TrkA [Alphaproteobacteria bacterium]|nr:Trk system potassium transporter TrkA [Alphaproteobacteria bacterium]